ncbi:MAG TPA: Rossmann-like and DUF2520 domain-containing protein [Anaerovoracaceae bacterium]|nr:Rossmann-like and DUF2520 domain-containing protein [Anaerovoracaceae bacterium]
MNVGFIGAGKVGFSLGKLFVNNSIKVTGYKSKSIESAIKAADFTKTESFATIEAIVKKSDIIFITVPDGEILSVWNHIKELPVKEKIICHCSGCLTSIIFDGINEAGAYGYSIHPFFPIRDKWHSYMELSEATFTIEGAFFHLETVKTLLEKITPNVQIIENDNKDIYHAAAVFSSNLAISLWSISKNMLMDCGFSEELAEKTMAPLFLSNTENLCKYGDVNSLTGPIERADIETIEKHLNCIEGDYLQVYSLLSKELIKVAEKKNPNREYKKLKELILIKGGNNEKHDNDI